ncbi:hypothetical protein B0H19DRAFT_1122094 [Mycena capillaripes]|nr:hypothetical protein B0H19DRAFT_1122094 [Mycena capillaripes]
MHATEDGERDAHQVEFLFTEDQLARYAAAGIMIYSRSTSMVATTTVSCVTTAKAIRARSICAITVGS